MIASRTHTLLKDDRKDLRIPERGRIPWKIKYKKREGVAKIHNISVSGMLIETDTPFDQKDECILSFNSDQDMGMYIPQIGRLVWSKKKKFSRKKYLCGIKFLEADEDVLIKMRAKVQRGVDQFVRNHQVVSKVGGALAVVIVALIGTLVWFGAGIYNDITATNQRVLSLSGQQTALSQDYRNLYRTNEAKLSQVTEKLHIADQLIQEDKAAIALFSQELEATKALLNQTETMLIQANDRNIELNSQLQLSGGQQSVVASTGNSPTSVVGEENIATIADARSLMSTYRAKIRTVKGEMKRLKSEERSRLVSAMTQMEDQRLLIGNNGYFVKSGQVVEVDEAKYQELDPRFLQKSQAQSGNQNIAIDVTFVE